MSGQQCRGETGSVLFFVICPVVHGAFLCINRSALTDLFGCLIAAKCKVIKLHQAMNVSIGKPIAKLTTGWSGTECICFKHNWWVLCSIVTLLLVSRAFLLKPLASQSTTLMRAVRVNRNNAVLKCYTELRGAAALVITFCWFNPKCNLFHIYNNLVILPLVNINIWTVAVFNVCAALWSSVMMDWTANVSLELSALTLLFCFTPMIIKWNI